MNITDKLAALRQPPSESDRATMSEYHCLQASADAYAARLALAVELLRRVLHEDGLRHSTECDCATFLAHYDEERA